MISKFSAHQAYPSKLPEDTLGNIISFLPLKDVAAMKQVAKKFDKLSLYDYVENARIYSLNDLSKTAKKIPNLVRLELRTRKLPPDELVKTYILRSLPCPVSPDIVGPGSTSSASSSSASSVSANAIFREKFGWEVTNGPLGHSYHFQHFEPTGELLNERPLEVSPKLEILDLSKNGCRYHTEGANYTVPIRIVNAKALHTIVLCNCEPGMKIEIPPSVQTILMERCCVCIISADRGRTIPGFTRVRPRSLSDPGNKYVRES